jgi:hypothetical protein
VPVATTRRRREARDRRRFIQGTLPLLLALTACEVPSQLDLRSIVRDASGTAMEARLAPPGMDRPTPNLASVPPVAQRPDLALRSGVTSRLEQDRAASLAALPARDLPAPARPPAPGSPASAGAPPSPPRLSPAVAVPWISQGGAPVEPSGQSLAPGAVPTPPPPELLAPAPPSLAPAPASR